MGENEHEYYSENCELYRQGKINQEHKEFFTRLGKEYPFTEIR